MPKRCYYFQRFEHLVFVFLPISDVLLEICGRLRGESIVKESLRVTYCGFCKRLPVSAAPRASMSTLGGFYKRLLTSTVPRASTNQRGLQPIITEGCPRTAWKCSTGCLEMHSSDIGLCICTGQLASNSLVRCGIFAYSLNLLTSTIIRRSCWYPYHQRLSNRSTMWCTEHISMTLMMIHSSKYSVIID